MGVSPKEKFGVGLYTASPLYVIISCGLFASPKESFGQSLTHYLLHDCLTTKNTKDFTEGTEFKLLKRNNVESLAQHLRKSVLSAGDKRLRSNQIEWTKNFKAKKNSRSAKNAKPTKRIFKTFKSIFFSVKSLCELYINLCGLCVRKNYIRLGLIPNLPRFNSLQLQHFVAIFGFGAISFPFS